MDVLVDELLTFTSRTHPRFKIAFSWACSGYVAEKSSHRTKAAAKLTYDMACFLSPPSLLAVVS